VPSFGSQSDSTQRGQGSQSGEGPKRAQNNQGALGGRPTFAAAPAVSLKAAFGYGWSQFRSNAFVWVTFAVAALAIRLALSALYLTEMWGWITRMWTALTEDPTAQVPAPAALAQFGTASALNYAAGIVFTVILALGLVAALRTTEGHRPTLSHLLTPSKAGRVLLAGLVLGMVEFVLSLTFVGSFIWQFVAIFVVALVWDTDTTMLRAIGGSLQIVTRSMMSVLALLLSIAGLVVLSVLTLGLGFIVTIPVSLLAVAYAYRVLTGQEIK
jgi:uncharacterized membrane protein